MHLEGSDLIVQTPFMSSSEFDSRSAYGDSCGHLISLDQAFLDLSASLSVPRLHAIKAGTSPTSYLPSVLAPEVCSTKSLPAMFVLQNVLPTFGLAVFSLAASVQSLPHSYCDGKTANVTSVDTVPGTTTLENLAVRRNGNILVAFVASPILHQLSPTNEHPPIPVASINGVTGLLGISEMEHDSFYVVGSNLTSTENSNGVWKVNIRNFENSRNGTIIQPAEVSLV